MRVRTWTPAVAATALLVTGAAAPAIAAAGNAYASDSSTSRVDDTGRAVVLDRGQMHRQMMQQVPQMFGTQKDMMRQMCTMDRVQGRMLGEHAGQRMPSTPVDEDQGEEL